MTEERRCYTFTDFMLSSIQQGIQSGHASMEIAHKYMVKEGKGHWPKEFAEQIAEWMAYPTIIALNGGNVANLHKIREFLSDGQNPFPFAHFVEEEDQGGNITSVAVILPERIFDTAQFLRRRELPPGISYCFDRMLDEHRFSFDDDDGIRIETFTSWEYELMTRLNQYRLAS